MHTMDAIYNLPDFIDERPSLICRVLQLKQAPYLFILTFSVYP